MGGEHLAVLSGSQQYIGVSGQFYVLVALHPGEISSSIHWVGGSKHRIPWLTN